MQQHYAVVIEEPVAFAKEGVIEADADMLEHANRDDAIEFLRHVAVILQPEPDLVGQALLGGARACKRELSFR
jgi:hypothetical protein